MVAKILLVEDERELRENLAELLEIHGYAVVSVSNGMDGLQKLGNDKFDIIISDVMMPKMDGHAFLKQVRAIPELSNVPFVFLTAKTSKDDTRKGMDGGAEDYLMKPIDETDLVRAVNSCLRKKANRMHWMENSIKEIVSSERNVKYHELRTPLFGILSTLEYLNTTDPAYLGDSENVELLRLAYQSAIRLNRSLLT